MTDTSLQVMCREAVGQRNIQNLVQNITIQQKVTVTNNNNDHI